MGEVKPEKAKAEDGKFKEVTLGDGRVVGVRATPPTLGEVAQLGGVITTVFAEGPKLDLAKVISVLPDLAAVAVDGLTPEEVRDLPATVTTPIVDAAVDWLELVPLDALVSILSKAGSLFTAWAAQAKKGSAEGSDESPPASAPPSG